MKRKERAKALQAEYGISDSDSDSEEDLFDRVKKTLAQNNDGSLVQTLDSLKKDTSMDDLISQAESELQPSNEVSMSQEIGSQFVATQASQNPEGIDINSLELVDLKIDMGSLFCSTECGDAWSFRTGGSTWARKLLYQAEKGICQDCGLDTKELCFQLKNCDSQEERRRMLEEKGITYKVNRLVNNPTMSNIWEADHIVPVAEGGGECGLDNYQTLCVQCHQNKTNREHERRAKLRKEQRKEEKRLEKLKRKREKELEKKRKKRRLELDSDSDVL